MAALAEADLKKILGDSYKEIDLLAKDPEETKREAEKIFREKLDKFDNARFSAIALMVVGAVMTASNESAFSGPSVAAVSIVGVVFALLGVAWFFYIRNLQQKLVAAGPTPA